MLPIFAGFLAGSAHVISGPDHLAALAPIALDVPQSAQSMGIRWGVGHGMGVLILGGLGIVTQSTFDLNMISAWSEFLVGFILMGVGGWAFYKAKGIVIHTHPHDHKHEKSDNDIHRHSSHEHIHMLQACYFSERVKYEDETDRVNFLKTLLKDPENDFRFISYFFKIDEMEARLHEVILSYYRNQGELPLDEKGFMKLLIGSKSEVGISVKKGLFGGLKNRPYRKRIEYEVRGEAEERDLISAIFHLTDPFGYLLQVLPVMYGNLLILYGDTNRAKKYLETVSSFELYNKLYGEVIIPV